MLRWLLVVQRISCSVTVLVWRCLLGSASAYLCELRISVSNVSVRRALRSSVSGQLLMPRATTATRLGVPHCWSLYLEWTPIGRDRVAKNTGCSHPEFISFTGTTAGSEA